MTFVTSTLDTVVNLLKLYENILIVIHLSPDGDTIASSLALTKALQVLNKNVVVVGKDPIPKPFEYLPGIELIQKDFLQGDWEAIIVMDCGDLKRTGFMDRIKEFALRKKRLINIDHHPKNDLHKLANVNLFDTEASATGEIIYTIIKKLNVKIDKDIATNLLTAIYTDTGGFKHSNTTNNTLTIASDLLSCGARLKKITQNITVNKNISSLKLWGLALSRIQKSPCQRIISSIITNKDILATNSTIEDLAGVVNMLASVPNAKASILFSEVADGQVRASLRTEDSKVDVSRIAAFYNGGGHKKAAGFTIPGKILEKQGKWSIILK